MSLIEDSCALCAQSRERVEDTFVRVTMSLESLRTGRRRHLRGGSDTETPEESVQEGPDGLEERVRSKLGAGDLFPITRLTHWAGPATGQRCGVCGQAISSGYECEVDGPSGSVYAHQVCHSIWFRLSDGDGDHLRGGRGQGGSST